VLYSKRTAPRPWLSGANWRPEQPLLRDYWILVRIDSRRPRGRAPHASRPRVPIRHRMHRGSHAGGTFRTANERRLIW
jgi:hypothetical protein